MAKLSKGPKRPNPNGFGHGLFASMYSTLTLAAITLPTVLEEPKRGQTFGQQPHVLPIRF